MVSGPQLLLSAGSSSVVLAQAGCQCKLTRKDGQLAVEKFARDGSGLISSLREADGLIEVAEEVTDVREGELVDFIPFTEFGLEPRR